LYNFCRCIIDEQLKRVKATTKPPKDEYENEFEEEDGQIEVIPHVMVS
jgi:hypothetical protein